MNGTVVVFLVVLVIVLGAGAGALLVYFTRFKRPFKGPGVTAPAVVTGIRRQTYSAIGDRPYFARVDVTPPAGRPFTTEIRLVGTEWGPLVEPFGAYVRVGMRIIVNFDPANPLVAELNAAATRPLLTS